jgi:hypothetical protein
MKVRTGCNPCPLQARMSWGVEVNAWRRPESMRTPTSILPAFSLVLRHLIDSLGDFRVLKPPEFCVANSCLWCHKLRHGTTLSLRVQHKSLRSVPKDRMVDRHERLRTPLVQARCTQEIGSFSRRNIAVIATHAFTLQPLITHA